MLEACRLKTSRDQSVQSVVVAREVPLHLPLSKAPKTYLLVRLTTW